MTVIAAIVHGDKVTMAADTQCDIGYDSIVHRQKISVHRPLNSSRPPVLLGVAGHGGYGTTARETFDKNPPPPEGLDRWATTIACLLTANARARSYVDADGEIAAIALLAVRDHLYLVTTDAAVPITTDDDGYGYYAIGSGGPIALGSLHTTNTCRELRHDGTNGPQERTVDRLIFACVAARDWSASCSGEIQIETTA